MDAALDRLEMLLMRQESLGSDPRAAAANRQLIFDLQTRITVRLPRGLAGPNAATRLVLSRWNRLVATMNLLESPSQSRTPATMEPRVRQIDDPFIDLPYALRLAIADDSPSVSIWTFDRRAVNGLGACLLCLGAIPVFRRLIRLEWGVWLKTRATIAWLLLGLVWWLCLTPGPVGPVIIAAAIIHSLVYRRQARNSVLVVDD